MIRARRLVTVVIPSSSTTTTTTTAARLHRRSAAACPLHRPASASFTTAPPPPPPPHSPSLGSATPPGDSHPHPKPPGSHKTSRGGSSSSSNLLKGAAATTCLLGIGTLAWFHQKLQETGSNADFKAVVEATIRGVRLGATVVMMISDYELAKYWPTTDGGHDRMNRDLEIALEVAETELRKAQDDHDMISRQVEEADTPEKRQALLPLNKEARLRVLQCAERLAHLDETVKGLSSKGKIHQRAAQRMLRLCQVNGGAYIKIGQHLSQMDYLLPREYLDTLRVLLNRAPVSSIHDVREVIKQDLGKYPEEIWAQFDSKPIASASLAQVHEAYDHEGRHLAIKVQHRGLRETSRGDIAAVTLIVDLVARIFPEFSYQWLAQEMAPQLPRELDFVNEGKNAERAAHCFKGREDVVIPRVIWDHTSARVLTMEFEEGACATDVRALQSFGLSLREVSALVSRVFCEQIFCSGWVHCDPHPANVLIRPLAGRANRPQMVLLDHGLYKELDDDFRLDYCRLWKALVLKDLPSVKYYCQKLNSGDMYTLLAAILTNRSWDDITDPDLGSLQMPNTHKEKTLLRTYAQKYLIEIQEILNKVPRQMLLLLKTNDCLRHIERSLGTPVNSSFIAAQESARAILMEDLKNSKSLTKRVRAWCSFWQVKLRIEFYLMLLWVRERVMPLLESLRPMRPALLPAPANA